MAQTIIPIDLGSNRKGAVKVSDDQVTYFGIVKPTGTAETMVTRNRKEYTRKVYKGLGDAEPDTVAVRASTWQTPVRAASGVTGKKVVVPTTLKTTAGSIRTTTFHFPSNATVGAISNWLFEQLVRNRPTSFLHNGQRYAVLKATGDVNPGNTEPPDEVA